MNFNEEKSKVMVIGGKKFDTLNNAFIWPDDSNDPNLETDPHDRQCRFKMNRLDFRIQSFEYHKGGPLPKNF